MTYCSQCGCETGPGDMGHSTCATHTPADLLVPSEMLETETGDGLAEVVARFDVDSDGDIQNLQVWMGETNIIKALSEKQVVTIERECWKAALIVAKERRSEARIEVYRDRMELA